MSDIPRYHLLPTGTSKELITVLQSMEQRSMIDPDAPIKAWDAESDNWEVITGLIIDPDGTIRIYTDED